MYAVTGFEALSRICFGVVAIGNYYQTIQVGNPGAAAADKAVSGEDSNLSPCGSILVING